MDPNESIQGHQTLLDPPPCLLLNREFGSSFRGRVANNASREKLGRYRSNARTYKLASFPGEGPIERAEFFEFIFRRVGDGRAVTEGRNKSG